MSHSLHHHSQHAGQQELFSISERTLLKKIFNFFEIKIIIRQVLTPAAYTFET
jgi:hypothetical protein